MNSLEYSGVTPINNTTLEAMFGGYTSPTHKVASLEKSNKIIRLKRGLYVTSPSVSGRILSTELIANHVYGPSYISMETALRFYGLIPESVHLVKSMTLKHSRIFKNEIAQFDYVYCPAEYYAIGVEQVVNADYSFMIASPEKALCDLIAYTPQLRPRFVKSMKQYLEEDIRLDMDEFYNMKPAIFEACAQVSKKRNEIINIIKLLER